jgi:AbiU2
LDVVKNAESRIAGLSSMLTRSVQYRRNQAIAHLDPATVIDPAALAVSAKLTLVDLTKMFDETGAILNEISRLWADTYAFMEFTNGDDFKSALDLIAEAKHAQVDKWEKEFTEPCPIQRPQTPRTPW